MNQVQKALEGGSIALTRALEMIESVSSSFNWEDITLTKQRLERLNDTLTALRTGELVVVNGERLEEAVQSVSHKPRTYHFVCYGGGTVKMVDLIDVVPGKQCRYQGDKNWLTPQCEECTGIVGSLELEMWERRQNAGIKRLAAYLQGGQ